jgi:hypothetical protein
MSPSHLLPLPEVKVGDKLTNIPGFPKATVVHAFGEDPFPEHDVKLTWNPSVQKSPVFGVQVGAEYNMDQQADQPVNLLGLTIVANKEAITGLQNKYLASYSASAGAGNGTQTAISLMDDEVIKGFRGKRIIHRRDIFLICCLSNF